MYSTFGSKEELVRAYLEGRAEARKQRIAKRIARHDLPRDRILAIYDLLGETAGAPTFRGCAFVNASAEGPRGESKVSQVCAGSRAWLRGLFTELARDCGCADPATLGRQLAILYDGAIVAASMERDPHAAADARAMAEILLDAGGGAKPSGRRRARTVKRSQA